MSFVAHILMVGLLTGGFLLLIAGIFHLVDPTHLQAALQSAPKWWRAIAKLARPVGAVESGIGAFTVVALIEGSPAAIGLAALLAGSTYFMFTLWLLAARQRAAESPCGCGPDNAPISSVIVVRALGLTAVSLVAVIWAFQAGGAESPPATSLSTEVVVSAAALAVVLWVLPTALFDPLEAQEATT